MEIPLNPLPVEAVDDDCQDVADNAADRRIHARHIKVMRIARLSSRQLDAEGLGLVRDISTGGMMIDAHFDLQIGQPVCIALLDDQALSGTIAWKDGRTVGVRFDSETPVQDVLAKPLENPDGTRTRLPRFTINMEAEIAIASRKFASKICDISQRGAKLRCGPKLSMHSNVLIKAGENPPVRGTVKWRGGEFHGVEFHRLLSVEELAGWLRAD
ncbi:MAG: PilZ domain-containing protein [Sphingorhabdus sp.]